MNILLRPTSAFFGVAELLVQCGLCFYAFFQFLRYLLSTCFPFVLLFVSNKCYKLSALSLQTFHLVVQCRCGALQALQDTKAAQEAASKQLRLALAANHPSLDAVRCFVAQIPCDTDHKNHYIGPVRILTEACSLVVNSLVLQCRQIITIYNVLARHEHKSITTAASQ